MNTRSIKKSEIGEKWYLVDATGIRIGVAASKIAQLLLGKLNPKTVDYLNPNVKVVLINAEKIDFTPKRGFSKFYKNYSGFPGGLRFTSLDEMIKTHPTRPLEIAIKGMLPKNKRGNAIITNLFSYVGESHPHEAQNPEVINLKEVNL